MSGSYGEMHPLPPAHYPAAGTVTSSTPVTAPFLGCSRSYFSCGFSKGPDKRNLRRKRFILPHSGGCDLLQGETQREEHEEAMSLQPGSPELGA